MKRFLCGLTVLGLFVGGEGQGNGQPTYAFTTLDVPGAFFLNNSPSATGINASGQIVGWYANAVLDSLHSFLYDQGSYTRLEVPGASSTNANGINASGQIVGTYADSASPPNNHGFLLDQGNYTTLDPPGSFETVASGINDSGQIVGWYGDTAGGHGFLLAQGSYTTLDLPGSSGTEAYGINDSGQIVGSYVGADEGLHGF